MAEIIDGAPLRLQWQPEFLILCKAERGSSPNRDPERNLKEAVMYSTPASKATRTRQRELCLCATRLEMAKVWDVAALLRKLAKAEAGERQGAGPKGPSQAGDEEEQKSEDPPPVCTAELTTVETLTDYPTPPHFLSQTIFSVL